MKLRSWFKLFNWTQNDFFSSLRHIANESTRTVPKFGPILIDDAFCQLTHLSGTEATSVGVGPNFSTRSKFRHCTCMSGGVSQVNLFWFSTCLSQEHNSRKWYVQFIHVPSRTVFQALDDHLFLLWSLGSRSQETPQTLECTQALDVG